MNAGVICLIIFLSLLALAVIIVSTWYITWYSCSRSSDNGVRSLAVVDEHSQIPVTHKINDADVSLARIANVVPNETPVGLTIKNGNEVTVVRQQNYMDYLISDSSSYTLQTNNNACAIINNHPAICLLVYSPLRLIYIRSNDIEGTSWPEEPTTIPLTVTQYNLLSLGTLSTGFPFIYVNNSYTSCIDDVNGTNGSWSIPIDVMDVLGLSLTNTSNTEQMQVIEGHPAVIVSDDSNMFVFNRSLSANPVTASDWSIDNNILIASSNLYTDIVMKSNTTNTHVAYIGLDIATSTEPHILIRTSTDAHASGFSQPVDTGYIFEPRDVSFFKGTFTMGFLSNGVPYVIFGERQQFYTNNDVTTNIYFGCATSVDATEWTIPVVIGVCSSKNSFTSASTQLVNDKPIFTSMHDGGVQVLYSLDEKGTEWSPNQNVISLTTEGYPKLAVRENKAPYICCARRDIFGDYDMINNIIPSLSYNIQW